MRLIDKFTLWFVLITSVVLVVGGWIVFTKVQHEIDQEAIRRIKSHIDNIATELRQGKTPEEISRDQVEIEEIDPAKPAIEMNVYDTMAVYRPRMVALDRKLTVESSFHIGNKHYRISMYDFVAEPDEIADGVTSSLVWTFVILVVIVGITNVIISRRILSPFHKTLRVIETFSLKKTSHIQLPATRTKEFAQLNFFLEKMTRKAQGDYRALKEFTENASHELQTPLAIIRGKLELLLESPLTDEQATQIMAALSSIERLSKVNHSLALLNKLGNQEFVPTGKVNLSRHVDTTLGELGELIDMKSIVLHRQVKENVHVAIHPSLADTLLMNIFSNAIRHNVAHGEIRITLNQDALVVENTGRKPEFPVDQVFERFKRASQSQDSIGLGLAIAKQICELSGFTIDYGYRNERHILTVGFSH